MPWRSLMLILLLVRPAAAQWEEAIALLEQGRGTAALERLSGQAPEARILRAEALWQSRRYVEMEQALTELEEVKAALLPSPFDFRLLKLRGHHHRLRGRWNAAVRYYQDALARARSPGQKVEALDALALVESLREDTVAAHRYLERGVPLVAAMESDSGLADHLVLVGQLSEARGGRVEAMTSYASARALYRRLGMPNKMARAWMRISAALHAEGRRDEAVEEVSKCWNELKGIEDPEGPAELVDQLTRLGNLQHGRDAEVLSLLESLTRELPPGPARDRALLRWAGQLIHRGQNARARDVLQPVLASAGVADEVRGAALILLSRQASGEGRLEEALEFLEQAEPLVVPRPAQDPFASFSAGELWTMRGKLERTLGRSQAALQSFTRALELQPGEDLGPARLLTRREIIATRLSTYDLVEAQREMAALLQTALESVTTRERVEGLISLVRVVEEARRIRTDELLPHPTVLGGKDPLARLLLQDVLESPDTLRRCFDELDRAASQARQARDLPRVVVALHWKGRFLELAERWPEARSTTQEMVELADQSSLSALALDGVWMLGRIEEAAGRHEAALQAFREGESRGWKLSPVDGRSYSYTLATYLRERGEYAAALPIYERAMRGSQRPANRLFGRALCLEALDRPAEALAELDKAESTLDPLTFPQSVAALRAMRARLRMRQGETEAALDPLLEAHRVLWSGGDMRLALTATLDASVALQRLGREEQALALVRADLDHLLAVPGERHELVEQLARRVVSLALRLGHHDLALDYLERSRSAELIGQIRLQNFSAKDPDAAPLLARLDELQARLAALQGMRADEGRARILTRRARSFSPGSTSSSARSRISRHWFRCPARVFRLCKAG